MIEALAFSPSVMFVMFAVGIFAGLIDAMVGGGGLITVPFLLNLGLPPATALGTNRLQSCFGEFNATRHFLQKKVIRLSSLTRGFVFTFIGAALGTLCVQVIQGNFLLKLLPFLLLLVFIYTVCKPSVHVSRPRLTRKTFFLVFGLAIGFYNGFLGPATGSFWMFCLMYWMAMPILQASFSARPLNLAGNIASFLFFAVNAQVNYTVALTMGVGQLIGGWIGAGLVMSKGHKIVKPLFLIVVAWMTVQLFVKAYG